jgi:hypothetical protein
MNATRTKTARTKSRKQPIRVLILPLEDAEVRFETDSLHDAEVFAGEYNKAALEAGLGLVAFIDCHQRVIKKRPARRRSS